MGTNEGIYDLRFTIYDFKGQRGANGMRRGAVQIINHQSSIINAFPRRTFALLDGALH
jgi:hypothetical protein